MTKDQFWKIIQRSLDRSHGDTDRYAQDLKAGLIQLSPQEIIAFDHQVEECLRESYSRDLWGAAYIIAGGCSDDGFEYFRRWLVSRGQDWFEKALKNPDCLADYPEKLSDSGVEFEEFAYLAPKAFEKKTGTPFPYETSRPYTLTGEDWEDDENILRERWPKLFAKYW